jgi:hypothetical protein
MKNCYECGREINPDREPLYTSTGNLTIYTCYQCLEKALGRAMTETLPDGRVVTIGHDWPKITMSFYSRLDGKLDPSRTGGRR